ncbi:dipeptidase [Halanaerobaculum tunisiense]
MKVIDFHCDTMAKIFNSDQQIKFVANDLAVDITKLQAADSLAQFFALYIDLNSEVTQGANKFEEALAMLDQFYQLVEQNQEDLAIARNYQELKVNQKQDKISALLSIEEGGVLQGKVSNLHKVYLLGVRAITLTWNYPNQLGYPNSKLEYRDQGLTPCGKQMVEEMNRLGMLVDVSHLSDQGVWDVLDLSTQPVIASHSNARAIKNNPRNLTDDLIKAIAQQGGIIGVNFVADFVADKQVAKIEDIIKHIRHIKQVGGSDVVALGSDFDGTECEMEISDISQMDKLIQGLRKTDFSGAEMDKILFKNGQRVLKEVLG